MVRTVLIFGIYEFPFLDFRYVKLFPLNFFDRFNTAYLFGILDLLFFLYRFLLVVVLLFTLPHDLLSRTLPFFHLYLLPEDSDPLAYLTLILAFDGLDVAHKSDLLVGLALKAAGLPQQTPLLTLFGSHDTRYLVEHIQQVPTAKFICASWYRHRRFLTYPRWRRGLLSAC